jgi:hypothetical protein
MSNGPGHALRDGLKIDWLSGAIGSRGYTAFAPALSAVTVQSPFPSPSSFAGGQAMDYPRFDNIARAFGTEPTRRNLLSAIGGGLASTLVEGAPGHDAAAHPQKVKQCRPPGQPCRKDTQCCAKACLDNGVCGCFSAAVGEIPCPAGCRCDQVLPGAVGACVEDIDVTSCCGSLPLCGTNKDCGASGFCDVSVCSNMTVCVRRCAA